MKSDDVLMCKSPYDRGACSYPEWCAKNARCFYDGSIKRHTALAQMVIQSRETSHGDYLHQSTFAQELKKAFRDRSEGWKALSPEQRESLDMIAVKISRILTGNPNTADHWTDVAGYATLISNLITRGTTL